MFNQHYSHQRQTKKVLRLRFSLRQDKDWQKLATKRTSIHTILHEYNLDNSHDNQLCVSLDNASRHHSFNHAFFLLFRAHALPQSLFNVCCVAWNVRDFGRVGSNRKTCKTFSPHNQKTF